MDMSNLPTADEIHAEGRDFGPVQTTNSNSLDSLIVLASDEVLLPHEPF